MIFKTLFILALSLEKRPTEALQMKQIEWRSTCTCVQSVSFYRHFGRVQICDKNGRFWSNRVETQPDLGLSWLQLQNDRFLINIAYLNTNLWKWSGEVFKKFGRWHFEETVTMHKEKQYVSFLALCSEFINRYFTCLESEMLSTWDKG